MSFHILRVCAVIIAFLAARALCAIDFWGENKLRLTSLLSLSGDLTDVVILDMAFMTAFVLGVMGVFAFFGVDGGEGVLFRLGVDGGEGVLFRLGVDGGVLAIYYMYGF
jgi:hypothetical protein